MSRGNGRMRIFLDDIDYRKFLHMLGDMLEAFGVECWDFCAMPTHYHLTVCPRQANLSRALRHLNSVYAMWWNAKHEKVGHVFQGRFKDQIVQREGYLRALCRYIALNPVRAGLVDHPAKWPWSSFRATAGLCRNPGFLFEDPVLAQFEGADAKESRARYVHHVLAGIQEVDELADRFRSKERVVGDPRFKVHVLGRAAVKPAGRELAVSGHNPGRVEIPTPLI